MNTNARVAAVALMLGNLMAALATISPAGMLSDLAVGLSVSIREAGFLMTFGAMLLCFMTPLMVWGTSTFDRRLLLVLMQAANAAGHIASAFAPDYTSLLVLRLVMLALLAAHTPVAASTIAQLVGERERPGAISFVFVGWALALAAGLPLVAFAAAHVGWRETFGGLGVAAAVVALLVMVSIPPGLRSAPLSLRSWGSIAQRPLLVVLLLISVIWTSGYSVIFPYIAPLIERLGGGGIAAVGASFSAMGVVGFVGNVLATTIVNRLGTFRTSILFYSMVMLGAVIWALGSSSVVALGIACALLGFTFGFNSMQQARLVAAAPALASATVALNTTASYVGQAIGSAIGAELLVRGHLLMMGYTNVVFMVVAMAALLITPRLR